MLDLPRALEVIRTWAAQRTSRYVCFSNVHAVVTARFDPGFAAVLRESDMTLADGEPVAWIMRRQGARAQKRISGPDLMWAYLAQAAADGESVFLYGSSPQTLEALEQRLADAFPGLAIAGSHSPPYRDLTPDEDEAVVDAINASGARTVWVGLGCPKQERWIAEHRGRVQAVMLGVGAAFDFHAGTRARAPGWMREHGLEWLHRLYSEPRRLWRRYLVTNSIFLVLAGWQLLRRRTGSAPRM